jgi:hypothetical protein
MILKELREVIKDWPDTTPVMIRLLHDDGEEDYEVERVWMENLIVVVEGLSYDTH